MVVHLLLLKGSMVRVFYPGFRISQIGHKSLDGVRSGTEEHYVPKPHLCPGGHRGFDSRIPGSAGSIPSMSSQNYLSMMVT